MRGPVPYVLALSGLAYLAYKADYLGLDAPDALKAFIVLPGAVLLVFAVLAAFPDSRRRLGGTLFAIGIIALLWLAREPLPGGGWTFYPPMSTPGTSRPPWLKGPEPILAAFAVGLPFLGLAILSRRSILGGLLLGTAFWCALCLAPSHSSSNAGMPRRYAYYYNESDRSLRPAGWDRNDAVLPILLGLAGLGLVVGTKRGGRVDDAHPPAPNDDRP